MTDQLSNDTISKLITATEEHEMEALRRENAALRALIAQYELTIQGLKQALELLSLENSPTK